MDKRDLFKAFLVENAYLGHGDPIGPHWDYTDKNGNKFRVFPDGRIEMK